MNKNNWFVVNIFSTIIMATIVIVTISGCSDKNIKDAQATINTIHPVLDTALTAAPVGHLTIYIMLAVDILSSVLAGLAACSKRVQPAEIGVSNGNNQIRPRNK